MMKSPFVSILTALIFILAFSASPLLAAQESEDVVGVTTLLSQDGVHPGKTVKTAVVLQIKPGYHINDNAPVDEFAFPTSLEFDDHPGLEVLEIVFPPGRAERFAYADDELIVYEGETVVGALLLVKPGQAPGKLSLKGTLSYQACDSVSCLPPKDVPFEIPVTVFPDDRKTTELHSGTFSKIAFKTLK